MNRTTLVALSLACACGHPSPEPVEPVEVAEIDDTGAEADTAAVESAEVEETGPMLLEAPDDVSAAPPGAEVTSSGLASRVLRRGTGTAHPTSSDRVTVHYVGWTTDGEKFDSSIERGEPATFPLSGVIAGWTEGVQLMVEGERRRFWIPADLAYGNSSRPGVPQGTLVFDVELIRIER